MIKIKQLATASYEFNTNKKPFDDIRIRKALNLVIDRDFISDKLFNGNKIATYNFTPHYIHGGKYIHKPEYATKPLSERIYEAKSLFKEAGFSEENPLIFELVYTHHSDVKIGALALVNFWKKAFGEAIQIKLRSLDWQSFLALKSQGDFSLAYSSWFADYNEASTFLTRYLSTNSKNNIGFKDTQYDHFIQSAYLAKTEEERAKRYAQAEDYLMNQHIILPIYHYIELAVKNPSLKGFDKENVLPLMYLKQLYFEPKSH